MTDSNSIEKTSATALSTETRNADDTLPSGGKEMSLFEHLGELRTRIVRSVLALVVFFSGAMFFAEDIIIFLKQPLVQALPPGVSALHFTGPMDVFMATMEVGFLTAVLLSCPVWIYQLWRFVEPALYPKERKYVVPFTIVSILLFLAGISFCFFFMLPMSLKFLLGMGMEVGTPIITIRDYLSLVTLLMFAFGAVFETPVILVLLASLGIIDVNTLTSQRRVVFVIILIIAAVITPPDPVSMMSMAIPMQLMYEISILIIRFMNRKKRA